MGCAFHIMLRLLPLTLRLNKSLNINIFISLKSVFSRGKILAIVKNRESC